jgi:hypothetical protein
VEDPGLSAKQQSRRRQKSGGSRALEPAASHLAKNPSVLAPTRRTTRQVRTRGPLLLAAHYPSGIGSDRRLSISAHASGRSDRSNPIELSTG